MTFCTDRDLLALAPTVFSDAAWASQQSVNLADGELSAGVLTSVSADFAQANVTAGSVALINGTPYEVIDRPDPGALILSLIRPTLTSPTTPGQDASAATVVVRSYQVQAEAVHDTVMRMLGLDPQAGGPTSPDDAVVSVSAVAGLEALGTLEWVYHVASAADPANPGLAQHAETFAAHFREALRTTTIHLDLDGDGYAERRARPGVPQLTRA